LFFRNSEQREDFHKNISKEVTNLTRKRQPPKHHKPTTQTPKSHHKKPYRKHHFPQNPPEKQPKKGPQRPIHSPKIVRKKSRKNGAPWATN
jgi:hypothetical protein